MPDQKHINSSPFTTALEAAVAYLVGMGIIKRDADVCAATGEKKSNFSAFKSGAVHPTKNFVLKFEDIYGIKLQDFDPETYKPKFLMAKQEPDEKPGNVDLFIKIQLRGRPEEVQQITESLYKLSLLASGELGEDTPGYDTRKEKILGKNVSLSPFENQDEKRRKKGSVSDKGK